MQSDNLNPSDKIDFFNELELLLNAQDISSPETSVKYDERLIELMRSALLQRKLELNEYDQLFEKIEDCAEAMTQLDFSKRLPVDTRDNRHHVYNFIALTLNLINEELSLNVFPKQVMIKLLELVGVKHFVVLGDSNNIELISHEMLSNIRDEDTDTANGYNDENEITVVSIDNESAVLNFLDRNFKCQIKSNLPFVDRGKEMKLLTFDIHSPVSEKLEAIQNKLTSAQREADELKKIIADLKKDRQ